MTELPDADVFRILHRMALIEARKQQTVTAPDPSPPPLERTIDAAGRTWTIPEWDGWFRTDVVVGIAHTLVALSEDGCPATDEAQDLIDLWHELFDSQVSDADDACRLAVWPTGRDLVATIEEYVSEKEFLDWEDANQERVTAWFRGLYAPCKALADAAEARWQWLNDWIEEEERSENEAYEAEWNAQHPENGDGNPGQGDDGPV